MADTSQLVSWAIERKCPFRSGEHWFLPNNTCTQLADLRTVTQAESDRRNVDGICITGWTGASDNSGNSHRIPVSGFRIQERLKAFGGLAEAIKTCGQCEAHAKSQPVQQVAGCFGHINVWPDSKELDQQLWQTIERLGLEARLRSAFPVTTPLWYGLWIRSPLHRVQAEVLHELLDAACDHDDPADREIVHFLNALKIGVTWELPIHVALAPLGHTDFGWYTVFPHCPRCKANAPVGRWQESYPTEPHQCTVCGQIFVPNEHHSSEQDGFDWEAQSLEKQLAPQDYQQLIRHFLLHEGCTEPQADEVIDNYTHGPLLRKVAQIRRKRNARLRAVRTVRGSKLATSELPRIDSVSLNDDVELELVLVPAGQFLMGSADTEEGHHENESPQHVVRIARPFYIGRFLVTQAQWLAVIGRNHSWHTGNPDLPVDRVSWLDCQEFCERLCARFRRVFRLPSEAEWEYACRAGTTTAFAYGETLAPDAANFTPLVQFTANPASDPKRRTTPVGSFPPNAWGIYDMHGNVDEWCEDVWHDNYAGAPTDGNPWLQGEDKQPFRVVRGGWCSATEFVCRSASRRQLRADAGSKDTDEVDPETFPDTLVDLVFSPYGFRVVCEVE